MKYATQNMLCLLSRTMDVLFNQTATLSLTLTIWITLGLLMVFSVINILFLCCIKDIDFLLLYVLESTHMQLACCVMEC